MNYQSTTEALDNCGIAYLSLSINLSIVELNQPCAHLLNKTVDELLNKNFSEVLPKNDAAKFSLALERLEKEPQHCVSFPLKELNGRSFEVKAWVAHGNVADSNSRFQCMFFDITAQRETARRLNEKNRLIDSMFETSLDAIIIANAEGRIVEWRGKADEIFGWRAEEAIGQSMDNLIIPEQYRDAHRHGMKRFNNTGEVRILNKRIEITALRKSGEEFPVELTIAQIFFNNKPYFSSFLRDITERKKNETEIWQQANFDPLTGLPNRRMFEERLDHEIKHAKRMGHKFGLLFIDLDHFKGVNDSLGHGKGDELLKQAATRLLSCTRESDMVARLGGDEFVILLDTVRSKILIEEIAQKIQEEIATPFEINHKRAYVSASIGITVYPNDGESAEELMNNADQAMYEAKNSGRNTARHFTPEIKEASNSRISLANNLHQALSNQELRIHYQPIVELRTGKIWKAEALLRWQHPLLGIVSPVRFIPISEELGLILQIGQWADDKIVHQLERWQRMFGEEFQISVNKSPVQFLKDVRAHKNWVERLGKHKLSGINLCIEITEGLLLNPEPIVYEKLNTYRKAGVQIAVDDFGTGYSSLLYLKEFPIDILKIDRSFVEGISEGSKEAILCEGIIALAHKLDIQVVGEGIETEFQRDFLIRAGCDFGQGYIFSHPLPAEEFEAYMLRQQH